MIGDKLVITDYHRQAAARIIEHVTSHFDLSEPIVITVSGESGCGKTETAQCIAVRMSEEGRRALILHQDDYFKLPPRTNHNKRLEDISWVGANEVRLDLLELHCAALKAGATEGLTKPLVFFEDDRIGEEVVASGPYDLIIAEGTYTAMLRSADVRAFIDRNYSQTKKARLKRDRDPDLDFLEKVLKVEHKIISAHKTLADVVIQPPADERHM